MKIQRIPSVSGMHLPLPLRASFCHQLWQDLCVHSSICVESKTQLLLQSSPSLSIIHPSCIIPSDIHITTKSGSNSRVAIFYAYHSFETDIMRALSIFLVILLGCLTIARAAGAFYPSFAAMDMMQSEWDGYEKSGSFRDHPYENVFETTPCKNGKAGSYACSHYDLHGFISHRSMGSSFGNDVWGTAPTSF